MKNRVEVMHGVNLDALGRRTPEHYGTTTLSELELRIKRFAYDLGLEVRFFQSNHEGEFVEYLHRLPEIADCTSASGTLRSGLFFACLMPIRVA